MTENYKNDDNKGSHLPEGVISMKGWKDLQLDEISTSGKYQVRESFNTDTIERYKYFYEEGEKLPPPYVFLDEETGKYEIINGHHRVEAARLAGLKSMEVHVANINEFATEQERLLALYAAAASHNLTNGLQFTIQDQMKVTRLLLTEDPNLRFSEVHAATGVKRSTFYRIQAELRGNPWKQDRKESTVDSVPEPTPEPTPECTVTFSDMIFCGNGCGTPAYPENLESPDTTWIKNDAGVWFCCEECRDEAESKALEAAGTAILEEGEKQERRNVMAELDEPKQKTSAVEEVKGGTPELKPCKICGHKPKFEDFNNGHGMVTCQYCNDHHLYVSTFTGAKIEEAVKAWNAAMGGGK